MNSILVIPLDSGISDDEVRQLSTSPLLGGGTVVLRPTTHPRGVHFDCDISHLEVKLNDLMSEVRNVMREDYAEREKMSGVIRDFNRLMWEAYHEATDEPSK